MLSDAGRQLIVSRQQLRGDFSPFIDSHQEFTLMVCEWQYEPDTLTALTHQLLNPPVRIVPRRNNIPAQYRHKLPPKLIMITAYIFWQYGHVPGRGEQERVRGEVR